MCNLMKRKYLILILVLLSSCSNKLEVELSGVFEEDINIGILNLTTVHIQPNGNPIAYEWRGYNVDSGDAFHVPFEEIELSYGSERYEISDKKAGNNELQINGELYKFDAKNQHLIISFGKGVSVGEGADYEAAKKIYDLE